MSTETWGISGPDFLVIYVLIAGVMLVLATLVRRSIRGRTATAGAGDLQARPEDVAYLNGGPELAVYAALSAMHVDGGIATSGPGSAGVVRSVGAVPANGSPLRHAIHSAAARPVARRTLPADPWVARALADIRERLERSGLLLTAARRRGYRGPAFWMLAVLVLGVVRLFAGLANGRPTGNLLVVLIVVVVVTVKLFLTTPARTRAGDAALREQRELHTALAPTMRPNWGAVGAGAAALSVGVFGVGALLAAEPAFAAELEAQRSLASGGAGGFGGGGGDGGGGGGGCGGGGCGGGGCGG